MSPQFAHTWMILCWRRWKSCGKHSTATICAPEPVLAASTNHYLTALYGLLFAPIQKIIDTTTLVIVPHGVLHYLPFHSFHDGTRHLIDTYAISYAPSASVFRYCARKSDV